MTKKVVEVSSGMQCIYCWVEVKERTGTAIKTWGKGEDEDQKRWVHASTHNAQGNQACSRSSLTDEEIEPIETETDEEA